MSRGLPDLYPILALQNGPTLDWYTRMRGINTITWQNPVQGWKDPSKCKRCHWKGPRPSNYLAIFTGRGNIFGNMRVSVCVSVALYRLNHWTYGSKFGTHSKDHHISDKLKGQGHQGQKCFQPSIRIEKPALQHDVYSYFSKPRYWVAFRCYSVNYCRTGIQWLASRHYRHSLSLQNTRATNLSSQKASVMTPMLESKLSPISIR